MLFEMSIIPISGETHLSSAIAEFLKIVDDSGLPYQLTPSGTCIEGEWDAVLNVVRQCHMNARKRSAHVITTVKIEDEADSSDKLTANVRSVEEKAGRKFTRAG